MSDPPPPPHVSPDGKFYWDGTRWVPMQGQAPAQPPPIAQQSQQLPAGSEIKKEGHGLRNGCIGCAGLIALLIIIGIAAGGSSRSPSTSGSSSPGTSGS